MKCAPTVPVIHSAKSGPIAIRLAMDLRSEGIEARPLALNTLAKDDWGNLGSTVAGLVIVYDGQTFISEAIQSVLRKMHPHRPVVFVRSRTSRFFPDFLEFHSVPLFEDRTFSYYQPHRKGRGGFADVIRYLGGGTRVKDHRRRGFAFLSYSSSDRVVVYEQLVPALAACNIGFFDYRFTERLDERNLEHDIERHIERSAIVVAYASTNWWHAEWTDYERTVARKIGRPVLAVMLDDQDVANDFPLISCRFSSDPEAHKIEMQRAIRQAVPTQYEP
jgi:TIR domain